MWRLRLLTLLASAPVCLTSGTPIQEDRAKPVDLDCQGDLCRNSEGQDYQSMLQWRVEDQSEPENLQDEDKNDEALLEMAQGIDEAAHDEGSAAKCRFAQAGMRCENFVHAALHFLNNKDDAMDFAEGHIEPWVQDRIYDFDGDGGWRHIVDADKEPKLIARLELMRHMYAARHAFVALSGLAGEEVEKQRKKISKAYLDVPEMFAYSDSEADADVHKRVKLAHQIRHVLKSKPVRHLLQTARACTLPHDHHRFGHTGHLNQRSRVRPDGPMTKDSYILLSEPDGTITDKDDLKMPLMTLGTGYGDCYKGKLIDYPAPGDKGVPQGDCRDYPSEGFYKQSVFLGVKAIDTAYIYGTEEQIGKELSGTKDSANVFISTKSMTPAFRNMLGVTHGTDRMAEQLQSLKRRTVNVLYNHHDRENETEWGFLEGEIKKGNARALGASHLDDAIEHEKCVKLGKCKYHISAVQEVFSPCDAHSKDLMRQIRNDVALYGNMTLVSHSGIHSCRGEPLMEGVAKRLGRSVAQVAIRVDLEQGIPVIVQTTKEHHLRENLAVFDFELSKADFSQLALIQTLYDIEDKDFFKD